MREHELDALESGPGPSQEGRGQSAVDRWRGAWDRVTRRRFIASILAAAGSLFRKNTAMAEKGGPDPVNAARREVDWDALRRRIKGEVVTANAPDFAAVRSALVWNKIKPDRSPDVIVRVKDEHDVVEAVNFARENGLKVVSAAAATPGAAWPCARAA